jgi:exonuclease SbcC
LEIAGVDELQKAAQQLTDRLNQASAAREHALGQVERLRQILEDCAKAAEQLVRRSSERDRLAKDKQAYTDLAAAFSKRGVQAHIIHNALPEIEDEANRLLAKLTDNSLQIKLDTQRQARAGSNQIETLDISITDEAGTRPYEMYSGGEAFRVNFALRIALSRLLARRAGANLQTLILDEGFGTQDAKGRERLVEAIEAVKAEFSLILVISHIEELKDAFPTRIEVSKTSSGSQITFVE